MKYSESAGKLRIMIEKAIEDHKITRAEMDTILHIASEDGHIDPHEQALLNQLQEMIENRTVKFVL
jgi:tellurite resistance protein